MPTERPFAAEHRALRRAVDELQREHDQLSGQRPVDMDAHQAHRMKLRKNIEALRAHKLQLGAH